MPTYKKLTNSKYLLALVSILLVVALTECSTDSYITTPQQKGSPLSAGIKYSGIPAQIKINTVLELKLTSEEATENPFDYNSIRLSAIFTDPTGKGYNVDGFYDGRSTPSNNFHWKLRFLPETVGTWQYKIYWSGQNTELTGKFTAIPGSPKALEHLARPQYQQRSLHTISGKPFYWIGGKWFSANNYGPQHKHGHDNKNSLTDTEIINYLDTLQKFKHNGILLKAALFPLNDDGISWDLDWVHRAEWVIEQALQRNIYVHLNIFDTWGREKGSPFASNTNGRNQVIDVWSGWFGKPVDNYKIENYIRTLIARFASYPNIFWELGNEMEHTPNCGSCFAKLANDYYIPLIRQLDPYDLPIALSEDIWESSDVDIALGHQTNKIMLNDIPQNKPFILNELVRSDDINKLWKGRTIRDSKNRLAYRRTFWRVLMNSGSGSSEASWLHIKEPLNTAVKLVMHDHMILANFVKYENIGPHNLTKTSIVANNNVESIATSIDNENFYIYLLENNPGIGLPDKLEIQLPESTFSITWYDTTLGTYQASDKLTSNGGVSTIIVPRTDLSDIVLCIKNIE